MIKKSSSLPFRRVLSEPAMPIGLMAPQAADGGKLFIIRGKPTRKIQVCKRLLHGNLDPGRTQNGFAFRKLRGETYRVEKRVSDAYLHALSKNLPAVQCVAANAVLDAISSHVLPVREKPDAGRLRF
jgi:hypothetical protein